MAYSTQMAAALSGATTGQIKGWRQDRGRGPVLVPEIQSRPKALYSFRDVLALRSFARLREKFSLQDIRKAMNNLAAMGELAHPSSYTLIEDGKTIVLYGDDTHSTDLLRKPGQRVIATLADIMEPFAPRPGVIIPHLLRPRAHVTVDPETQSGQPVITGTRVPYDAVTELLNDGVPADEIADYYPGVTAEAVQDAVDFARYVDSYDTGARAA